MNKMKQFLVIVFCCIGCVIFAQDGRIDTLISKDSRFEFIFRNNVDSNDVLTLDLLSTKRDNRFVGALGDTTIHIKHKFYNEFFLEFEGEKIFKYVVDKLNNQRYYVYTDDFTMPKGGRLELAYCLYGNVSYPEQAYQLKVEGLAFIQAYIDEKGCVTKAKPLTKIGYGIEQEMMKAVVKCGCAYESGKRNGVAVKSIWNIPMRFEL